MSERRSPSSQPDQPLPMPAYPLHAQRQQVPSQLVQQQHLLSQYQDMQAPVPQPKKPWYRQWWVWAVVAAVLLVIVVVVVLSSKSKAEPGALVAPPQAQVVEVAEPQEAEPEQ